MKILITGFEAFDGRATNASRDVVAALSSRRNQRDDESFAILPVDGEAGPRLLLDRVDEGRPDAVICLGETPRGARVVLERVFVNLRDYRIPDNSGATHADQPIDTNGPAAYFSTLPLRAIESRLRNARIPVRLSQDAGTYLCNQVCYALLHTLAQHGSATIAGFIHLPFTDRQIPHDGFSGRPAMSLDQMVDAVAIAIDAVRSAARDG